MATTKPQTTKTRPTVEERREMRLAEKQRAEVERARAMEEFNAQRPAVFQELFAKAMRLQLLFTRFSELKEIHSWYFADFSVDALAQTFTTETLGGAVVSQETLHPSDVARVHTGLDNALEWVQEYLDEQERKRLEAIEKENRRNAALAKLTDDDKRALGLRS